MIAPKDTLLLNADHTPMRVVDWQRAVWMVLTDRVLSLEVYEDMVVRSERLRVAWPAVVCLARQSPVDPSSLPLSRATLFARDGFTCQYCGWQATRGGRPWCEPLTLDHVVPRARALGGRVTLADGRVVPTSSWENLVTACHGCNHRKAARTPEQAGLALRAAPRRPTRQDVVRILFARVEVEPAWTAYLPEGTGVRRLSRAA